jgi:hypothetical protein
LDFIRDHGRRAFHAQDHDSGLLMGQSNKWPASCRCAPMRMVAASQLMPQSLQTLASNLVSVRVQLMNAGTTSSTHTTDDSAGHASQKRPDSTRHSRHRGPRDQGWYPPQGAGVRRVAERPRTASDLPEVLLDGIRRHGIQVTLFSPPAGIAALIVDLSAPP